MFSIQGFQTCIGQEKPDHNAEPVVGLVFPKISRQIRCQN